MHMPCMQSNHETVMKSTSQNTSARLKEGELSCGTTIVAASFKSGVVMAADSRTTMGSFISSCASDKLTGLTDRIYVCRSGSAADTQAVAEVIRYHLNFLEMETNERPTVRTTAHIAKDLCYSNRDNLLVSLIIAGWDKKEGGTIYSIPPGGFLSEPKPFALGGSGSTYCWGYADMNYKPNMTREECVKFAQDVLTLAMNRDGSSGGLMNFAVITETGVERFKIKGKDMPTYYLG